MYHKRFIPTALVAILLVSTAVDGFIPPKLTTRHVASTKVAAPLFFFKEQSDVPPTNLTDLIPPVPTAGKSESIENKTPFPSWPQPVIEAKGDYTEEAYLENLIGGPLYANNENLPRLPIPTLQETIERFLPTALPLCESDEEKQTLVEACNIFEEEARPLQERLQRRRREWPNSSWLQKWWNQKMYLEYRDPVAVHVSYFLNINDDPTLPTDGKTSLGILRGAAAILSAAEVRRRVCSGQAPCDKVGEVPLCSAGYKYIFNSCRIPRKESDTFRMYDPSLHKHCIVASRGYFFEVDVVDEEDNPFPYNVVVDRLERCESMAKEREERGVPKLGWLTGCDREFWASARSQLLEEGGPAMQDALKIMESGAFMLCLDDVHPKTLSEANSIFWNGNGKCGANRWYDKPIQLVCNSAGQIATVGEHSMIDGSIPMVICKQIQKNKYKRLQRNVVEQSFDTNGNALGRGKASGVKDIFQKCWKDGAFVALCKDIADKGQQKYQALTDSVELRTVLHQGYGKPFIKKGRCSPDAFLQLAMQLTAYRVFGTQLPTYEATQTRKCIHGRTETTRAVSMESRAFVKAMGPESRVDRDDVEDKYEKLLLLRKAAKAHRDYATCASNGHGVDRHFLGLSLVLKEEEQAPALFSHPAFVRSKTWRLSTSSLPYCPGFGPVVPDGLGVGYGLSSDSLVFNVSSRRANGYVDQFCDKLELVLEEMWSLLESEEMCDFAVPCDDE